MSWRTIALQDRVRTEQNAPLKTILTSALVPQGSRAQRVPKTSRNVQQPNPACTDNASTHMDRMRKYIVIVCIIYCSRKQVIIYVRGLVVVTPNTPHGLYALPTFLKIKY